MPPETVAESIIALLALTGMEIILGIDNIIFIAVITAVGMAEDLKVMIAAIIIAIVVMMIFAEPVSHFVHAHPTIKTLALSFLILIGVMLVAEGIGKEIEKGYIYFAMAFALIVELLNMRLSGPQRPPSEVSSQESAGEPVN